MGKKYWRGEGGAKQCVGAQLLLKSKQGICGIFSWLTWEDAEEDLPLLLNLLGFSVSYRWDSTMWCGLQVM